MVRHFSKHDIVPVQFGMRESTKTLALIEEMRVTERGEECDVLYNDGTSGKNVPRSILGDPIGSDEVEALLRHTFRDCHPHELFRFLTTLRNVILDSHGAGLTIGN